MALQGCPAVAKLKTKFLQPCHCKHSAPELCILWDLQRWHLTLGTQWLCCELATVLADASINKLIGGTHPLLMQLSNSLVTLTICHQGRVRTLNQWGLFSYLDSRLPHSVAEHFNEKSRNDEPLLEENQDILLISTLSIFLEWCENRWLSFCSRLRISILYEGQGVWGCSFLVLNPCDVHLENVLMPLPNIYILSLNSFSKFLFLWLLKR